MAFGGGIRVLWTLFLVCNSLLSQLLPGEVTQSQQSMRCKSFLVPFNFSAAVININYAKIPYENKFCTGPSEILLLLASVKDITLSICPRESIRSFYMPLTLITKLAVAYIYHHPISADN